MINLLHMNDKKCAVLIYSRNIHMLQRLKNLEKTWKNKNYLLLAKLTNISKSRWKYNSFTRADYYMCVSAALYVKNKKINWIRLAHWMWISNNNKSNTLLFVTLVIIMIDSLGMWKFQNKYSINSRRPLLL